jgi:hypothetical protein
VGRSSLGAERSGRGAGESSPREGCGRDSGAALDSGAEGRTRGSYLSTTGGALEGASEGRSRLTRGESEFSRPPSSGLRALGITTSPGLLLAPPLSSLGWTGRVGRTRAGFGVAASDSLPPAPSVVEGGRLSVLFGRKTAPAPASPEAEGLVLTEEGPGRRGS